MVPVVASACCNTDSCVHKNTYDVAYWTVVNSNVYQFIVCFWWMQGEVGGGYAKSKQTVINVALTKHE